MSMSLPQRRPKASPSRVLTAGLGVLIVAHVISVLLLSSVPPVSRDALTHHLFVPKLYLREGGMVEIPHVKFSYYPMNLDLLYLIPLYWGNDIVPKYIHFAFGLMTAGLVFHYLNRRIGRIYGLLGGLLLLTIPVVVKLSTTAYVDLGLTFFSTAALVSLLAWQEHSYKSTYLWIAAICCGLALGTKYNGLITFFLMTLLVPVLFVRGANSLPPTAVDLNRENTDAHPPAQGHRLQLKALFHAALFVSIALVCFSPWMVRNAIWTGNPIYPLYNRVFKASTDSFILNDLQNDSPTAEGDDNGLEGEGDEKSRKRRLSHFAIRKLIYGETGWQTALIPVRIFFEGRDDDPKYFDGRMNPVLFFFPFLAFISLKRDSRMIKTEKTVWLAFAVLYLLYAFVKTDMRIRYIAPIIPPLVILSVFGLHRAIRIADQLKATAARQFLKTAIISLLIFFMSLNLVYMVKLYGRVEPIGYLTGEIDRGQYIAKHRPEYDAIRFANANTSANAKILAVFLGNRGYYFERNVRFNNRLLIQATKTSASAADVADTIKAQGYSHLLIQFDLLNRWAARTLTPHQASLLGEFLERYTTRRFAGNGHGLFQVN